MAAIGPILEVGTPKLVYNPKFYMLGICGKKYQKSIVRPRKRCMTNVPPPGASELAQTSVHGGLNSHTSRIYCLLGLRDGTQVYAG